MLPAATLILYFNVKIFLSIANNYGSESLSHHTLICAESMQMANNMNDANQKHVFSHFLTFFTFPRFIYLLFEIHGERTEKKYKCLYRFV